MNDKKGKPVIGQLKEQIHQAILGREEEKAEALKYLLSILEKESYRQEGLDEEKIIALLRAEMKRKKEALRLFEKGKRDDLVAKEEQEIEWLKPFLGVK
ncbi:GatB/YqeY domain-containing protein [Candidatus Shapirobacteria bacterium]|nr:GatB/YqeY domain-containing protein [Candidatus Shapirobacteria bacterium]